MIAASLTGMQLKLARVTARVAIKAGGDVLAEAWRERVPVKDGYYRDAITVKTSTQSLGDVDDPMIRRLSGAMANIYPGVTPGPPDDEQPWRYASVLEFGGHLGPRQNNSYIPAQPSLRPAFDAAVDDCVDAVERVLHTALMIP
jgi:hypothetical protein